MGLDRKQKIQEVMEKFMAMQKALGPGKDHFLKSYSLTRPQMHILYALAHGKQLTVKDVATKMGITSSAATQIIEGLVQAKYVERKHDQKDRRVVHIRFSAQGKKKFENFRKAHIECLVSVFQVLSEKELDQLIYFIQKIIQNIKAS